MSEAGFVVELVGGVPVVTTPEEIDITNAPRLRAALLEERGTGAARLWWTCPGPSFVIRPGCTP